MVVLQDRGGNGDPEAARVEAPLPSLAPSPESNFTGSSKVAHSHPPKSQ